MFWGSLFAESKSSFSIDLSKHPGVLSTLGHQISVLDIEADLQSSVLENGRASGIEYLGHLNMFMVKKDSEFYSKLKEYEVPTLEHEGNEYIDISHPGWRVFVFKFGQAVEDLGFDGFFLDGTDLFPTLAKLFPGKQQEMKATFIKTVQELRRFYPKTKIILKQGAEDSADVNEFIDGVVFDSVFGGYDKSKQAYVDVPASSREAILARVDRAKQLGHHVFVIDYVEPSDSKRTREIEAKIRSIGAVPFLTNQNKKGIAASYTDFRRKLLVLYGHDPDIEERPQISSPLDIATESVVQATAEWMGYELIYHTIVNPLPSLSEMTDFAGVVVDDSLVIPFEQEYPIAKWMIGNIQAGRKLLFLGGIPFQDQISKELLFNHLKIKEGGEWSFPVTKTKIVLKDEEMMDFETETGPLAKDFLHLTAPENARVHLRLQDVSDAASSETRLFDAVYSCSWGGVILSPYMNFVSSEEVGLFHVNIPQMLSNIWPSDHWPVPDVTTQNGLRIFYSHIDGDGFTSASSVSRDSICGEVMYDKILKDLPFPITVSIVEAPLRGQLPHQKQKDIPRIQGVARKIFNLPHVEPASHSYSHPYVWDLNNLGVQAKRYETLNLPLKLTAKYPKISIEREIHGSLDFIRDELAPKDKPPAIMLWSGNCRPTGEVVSVADAAGVENMNGGDTILCSRYPGLGNVSGKLIAHGDRIQVLASNQNEFLYTNGWRGPYHGGFSQVVETFEQTETPVRLKPVNVYYHFYSVDRPAAMQALEKIYNWCREQDLHLMTAAEYARLVKDSHTTKLVRTGVRRWAVFSNGYAKTLRISNDLGYPDLEQSVGVIGFNRHEKWTYIHTNGAKRIELSVTDREPSRPYFKSSSTEVQFDQNDSEKMVFTVGKRDCIATFSEFKPNKKVTVSVDGAREAKPADAKGDLTLTLAAGTQIEISY